jgi:hypothetical protein
VQQRRQQRQYDGAVLWQHVALHPLVDRKERERLAEGLVADQPVQLLLVLVDGWLRPACDALERGRLDAMVHVAEEPCCVVIEVGRALELR